MFPLNKKEHVMGTRNQDKYKVQHAHTERIQQFMQNMLNEYES